MLLLLVRPTRTLSSEEEEEVSMVRVGTLSEGDDKRPLMATSGEDEDIEVGGCDKSKVKDR